MHGSCELEGREKIARRQPFDSEEESPTRASVIESEHARVLRQVLGLETHVLSGQGVLGQPSPRPLPLLDWVQVRLQL